MLLLHSLMLCKLSSNGDVHTLIVFSIVDTLVRGYSGTGVLTLSYMCGTFPYVYLTTCNVTTNINTLYVIIYLLLFIACNKNVCACVLRQFNFIFLVLCTFL